MTYSFCHESVDGCSSTTLGGGGRNPSHRFTRINADQNSREHDLICLRSPVLICVIRFCLWLIPGWLSRDYRRWTRPRCKAVVAACVRSLTPSLLRILLMWLLTVASLMFRR
jgi:hypothetical protein